MDPAGGAAAAAAAAAGNSSQSSGVQMDHFGKPRMVGVCRPCGRRFVAVERGDENAKLLNDCIEKGACGRCIALIAHGKNYVMNSENQDWGFILPCYICGDDVAVRMFDRWKYHVGEGPTMQGHKAHLFCGSCIEWRKVRQENAQKRQRGGEGGSQEAEADAL